MYTIEAVLVFGGTVVLMFAVVTILLFAQQHCAFDNTVGGSALPI